jgi:hypothetical protein
MLRDSRFRNPHLLGRISETTLIHNGGKGFHFGKAIHANVLTIQKLLNRYYPSIWAGLGRGPDNKGVSTRTDAGSETTGPVVLWTGCFNLCSNIRTQGPNRANYKEAASLVP